eukprot:gene53168-72617_t
MSTLKLLQTLASDRRGVTAVEYAVVAAGLTCTIFFYIMINLLMVVGLAPVAGIPLPFVSHGGSSMLTMMLCVGIMMSIERHPGAKRGQFQ